MRTQARGLAAAVTDDVIEKTVSGLWPWSRKSLIAPWPDLLVSCGRRSAGYAIAVRRASGGRTLIVHVQDPRWRADAFDLIVAMQHDSIRPAANVIKVATAVHDLTPEALAEAVDAWRERFARLSRPLTGIIVGGDLRGRPFTRADGERLIAALDRLRAGGGLAITPSRRTPDAVRALLHAAYGEDPNVFLWDLTGDNPYRGILALADRLVVTSDSVSMVSEALSAPHPVEVFDLDFPRHRQFTQRLVDLGLVRRFTGDPSHPPTTGPVNATANAAAVVKALLQTRTGMSG